MTGIADGNFGFKSPALITAIAMFIISEAPVKKCPIVGQGLVLFPALAKLPPFLNCMDKMAEQGCSKETVVKDDELDDLLESGSLTMLS